MVIGIRLQLEKWLLEKDSEIRETLDSDSFSHVRLYTNLVAILNLAVDKLKLKLELELKKTKPSKNNVNQASK